MTQLPAVYIAAVFDGDRPDDTASSLARRIDDLERSIALFADKVRKMQAERDMLKLELMMMDNANKKPL